MPSWSPLAPPESLVPRRCQSPCNHAFSCRCRRRRRGHQDGCCWGRCISAPEAGRGAGSDTSAGRFCRPAPCASGATAAGMPESLALLGLRTQRRRRAWGWGGAAASPLPLLPTRRALGALPGRGAEAGAPPALPRAPPCVLIHPPSAARARRPLGHPSVPSREIFVEL